jgi:predicted phage terminase large subunit-like protein
MTTAELLQEIRPHSGPQEQFLSTPADIAIYGGAAGGGKSYALLMEPLRHVDKPGFGAVIFRRTYPEITNEGGLWDTSEKLYSLYGARPRPSFLEWVFPFASTVVKFAHLQHEKDKHAWQGSAIPFIGFDELTHFTRGMFFYLLSRNRLTHDCKVRPYVRATCNPDPTSWVADFLSWWIDPKTGYPIPERAGKLRWFIRDGDSLVWSSKREDLLGKIDGVVPKSVTFIPSKLTDNPTLMRQDPQYISNLAALPTVDRMRLRDGNWKVRAVQGMMFRRDWYKIIEPELVPKGGKTVRYWDRAATEVSSASPDPDYTVGLKMRRVGTKFFVLHEVRMRGTPEAVLRTMKKTAEADGKDVEQVWEQDPGQAGKAEVSMLYREFVGYHVRSVPVTVRKALRAKPASSQSEAGNILIVRGIWNEDFLDELESFADWDEVLEQPPVYPHDDQVDAFSGAFNELSNSAIAGRGNF